MKALGNENKSVELNSVFAVQDLYFFDNRVVEIAKILNSSPRDELEITDNNMIDLNLVALAVGTLRGRRA